MNEFQNAVTTVFPGTETDHFYSVKGVGKNGIVGVRNLGGSHHRVRIQGWPGKKGALPERFTAKSAYHASCVVCTGELESTIQAALDYVQ